MRTITHNGNLCLVTHLEASTGDVLLLQYKLLLKLLSHKIESREISSSDSDVTTIYLYSTAMFTIAP